MDVIEIKNLTKYYGKIKGIENITFNVKKGENHFKEKITIMKLFLYL